MTERIVIGIDEGTASDAAVDWVIERAGSEAVQIVLVTAVDELMIDRQQDERLEHMRHRILEKLPDAGVEPVSAEGPLVQVMREHAQQADLLVVGNHRTRAVRSVLGGSAALRVAAASPIPTVVVPDDVAGGDGAIVVGLAADGSSDGAMGFAVAEARRSGAALDIVHAWGLPAAAEALGFPVGPAEVVVDHRAVLDSVGRRIRGEWPDLMVREFLTGDDEADALVSHASGARLMVLGTHGSDPISGLLRGSVGQAVMRRSRIPVCIVPAAWHEARATSAG